MTQHADRTSESAVLYGCSFDRPQLERLLSAVANDFPPEKVEAQTRRNGTLITRSSVGDLHQAVQNSLEPGNPNVWDNFTFSAWQVGRRVEVRANRDITHISVSGEDAGWVRGRFRHLEQLLNEDRRGPNRHPWDPFLSELMGLSVGVSVFAIFTILVNELDLTMSGKQFFLLTAGELVLIAAGGWIFGKRRQLLARTLIHVTGPLPRGPWWNQMTAGERAIVTTTIAVGLLAFTGTALWH